MDEPIQQRGVYKASKCRRGECACQIFEVSAKEKKTISDYLQEIDKNDLCWWWLTFISIIWMISLVSLLVIQNRAIRKLMKKKRKTP